MHSLTLLISPFLFICYYPPVLGPLEWYTTPTLNTALLTSSRAGADLGRTWDVESDALIVRLLQLLY